MNVPRMEEFLEYLKQLPPENFNYEFWLKTPGKIDPLLTEGKTLSVLEQAARTNMDPPCGTVGCVAGNCVILFWEESKSYFSKPWNSLTIGEIAAKILGLSSRQEDFLFMSFIKFSNKDDAIKRLEHLLSGISVDKYHWESETNPDKKLEPDYAY